jgi:hypothetical protein
LYNAGDAIQRPRSGAQPFKTLQAKEKQEIECELRNIFQFETLLPNNILLIAASFGRTLRTGIGSGHSRIAQRIERHERRIGQYH